MIIVMKCIKVRSYVVLSKRKMSFTLNLQQMVAKQKCDTKKKDKYTKKENYVSNLAIFSKLLLL